MRSTLVLLLLGLFAVGTTLAAAEEVPVETPAEIPAEKMAAIENHLKLIRAEESFKIGAKAGFAMGMDPKNNPALGMIPQHKLDKIIEKVGVLMEEKFTWEVVKGDFVAITHANYTLAELTELNEQLKHPALQKMIDVQLTTVPESMEIGSKHVRKLQPEIMRVTQEIMMEQ